jgi:hypothetical protein
MIATRDGEASRHTYRASESRVQAIFFRESPAGARIKLIEKI